MAAYLGAFVLEEVGPRPLVILNFVSLILIAGLCAFAPSDFQWFYMFSIFAIVGACCLGLNLSLSHYFLISIPSRDRVGVTLFMQVVSGLLAGLVGVVLGAGLIRFLHRFDFESSLRLYQVYFGIIGVVLIPMLLVIVRLERLKDWHLAKVLGLAFSPRDIITLYYMNSFEQLASPRHELENIEKLEDAGSELSEKLLLSYLDSPKFALRARALQSLGKIPFSENVAKALMRELAHGEHSTAYMAADILGKNKVQKAVPLLVKALDSPDYYLQGKCMISLADLQAGVAYDRIREIFMKSENPRTIIHGAASLAKIGHMHDFRLLLEKTAQLPAGGRIREELLCSLAELGGLGDSFYKFLKLFKVNQEEAVVYLLDELGNSGVPASLLKDLRPKLLSGSAIVTDPARLTSVVAGLCAGVSGAFNREIHAFIELHGTERLCLEFLYCMLAICAKESAQRVSL
ncbi:MAG: hypothetical protein A2X49_13725 [Lentisphaerae bacterium GWF2_52_8]|nr:MAG: hypothetical protein A2X49_13725 [Lentisphaerae bacterium GWF2_52_8]